MKLMVVIPSINTQDFETLKQRIAEAKSLGLDWVHLDVADGEFTNYTSFNNPLSLKISGIAKGIKIGAHLMVSDPDDVFEYWLEAGVKKIIIHSEAIIRNFRMIKQQCEKAGAELVIAISPESGIARLDEYLDLKNFLILAVPPGPSGQKFDDLQLEKIKLLRAKVPDAKIEVDGGITLDIAKKVKEAGADVIISGSYIWDSGNPAKALKDLWSI